MFQYNTKFPPKKQLSKCLFNAIKQNRAHFIGDDWISFKALMNQDIHIRQVYNHGSWIRVHI